MKYPGILIIVFAGFCAPAGRHGVRQLAAALFGGTDLTCAISEAV